MVVFAIAPVAITIVAAVVMIKVFMRILLFCVVQKRKAAPLNGYTRLIAIA